jgi:hypothetical protein
MTVPRALHGLLLLTCLIAFPAAGSERSTAPEPAADANSARVFILPNESELRFTPAPDGWQQDVAWQVFGFRGEAQPPQFFYRIPEDEAEAKALIDSISSSALVGRVQLLDARIEEASTDTTEGPVVSYIHGSWEV